jgi:endonuclease/exonuclease/phosphatase family metal-dependent hydrolase
MRPRSFALLVVALAAGGACAAEATEPGGQGLGATTTTVAGGSGGGSTSPGGGGLGAAGGLGGMGGGPGGGGGAPSELALLTLNLHCLLLDGTGFATNQQRFAAIATEVAAENVSVLALQEVCVQGDTVALELLEAAVEAATGSAWSSSWEHAHTAWQGTPDEADEGIALLVRGQLGATRALEFHTQGALRRVALAVELPTELGGLWAVATHLDYDVGAARLAQARELATYGLMLGASPGSVLVAGDFNDPKTGPAYAALVDYGYLDPSAELPASMIDQVFAHRGAPLAVTLAKQLFDGVDGPVVSDHPGVLVRFAPATPPALTVTTVRIHALPAPGTFFAVRGDVAPLDWGFGWPAQESSPGVWDLRLTELGAGPFAYKALRDDGTWQTGPNESGTAGQLNECWPSF